MWEFGATAERIRAVKKAANDKKWGESFLGSGFPMYFFYGWPSKHSKRFLRKKFGHERIFAGE